MKIKKLIGGVVATACTAVIALSAAGCSSSEKIYVDTNAFFAPFEYYGGESGSEIVGVDIDIMNLVGKKLNKEVVFENTSFGVIIDNVASGKKYDCGAAGITITEARKEQVDFSTPYFTSVQYVIYKGDEITVDGTTTSGVEYVLWDQLAGKKIGVQTNTTGDIYADLEVNGQLSDPDYEYDGVLYGTGASVVQFDNAQVAADALGVKVDVVVVDKLPAEYIVGKNSSLKCYALYYDAETATEEQYAICVTKGNTELLNAINEVLAELGEDGINALVSKHLGLSD
jgi:polar amino acid transport system substrate-binding protein